MKILDKIMSLNLNRFAMVNLDRPTYYVSTGLSLFLRNYFDSAFIEMIKEENKFSDK